MHPQSDEHLDRFESSVAYGHLDDIVAHLRTIPDLNASLQAAVCGIATAVAATGEDAYETAALAHGLRKRPSEIVAAIMENT